MRHIGRFRLFVIRHFAFINTDQRQGKGKSKVLCYTLQIYVWKSILCMDKSQQDKIKNILTKNVDVVVLDRSVGS